MATAVVNTCMTEGKKPAIPKSLGKNRKTIQNIPELFSSFSSFDFDWLCQAFFAIKFA